MRDARVSPGVAYLDRGSQPGTGRIFDVFQNCEWRAVIVVKPSGDRHGEGYEVYREEGPGGVLVNPLQLGREAATIDAIRWALSWAPLDPKAADLIEAAEAKRAGAAKGGDGGTKATDAPAKPADAGPVVALVLIDKASGEERATRDVRGKTPQQINGIRAGLYRGKGISKETHEVRTLTAADVAAEATA